VKTAIFNWIAFCYLTSTWFWFATRKQQRKCYIIFVNKLKVTFSWSVQQSSDELLPPASLLDLTKYKDSSSEYPSCIHITYFIFECLPNQYIKITVMAWMDEDVWNSGNVMGNILSLFLYCVQNLWMNAYIVVSQKKNVLDWRVIRRWCTWDWLFSLLVALPVTLIKFSLPHQCNFRHFRIFWPHYTCDPFVVLDIKLFLFWPYAIRWFFYWLL
jgi:hypothetical protein